MIESTRRPWPRRGRRYGPTPPKSIYRVTDRPKSSYTSAEEGEGSDLYRTSQFAEACRKLADVLDDIADEEELLARRPRRPREEGPFVGRPRRPREEGLYEEKGEVVARIKSALRRIRSGSETAVLNHETRPFSARPAVTPTGEAPKPDKTTSRKPVLNREPLEKKSAREELIREIVASQIEKGIVSEVEREEQKRILGSFSDKELQQVKLFLDGIVTPTPEVTVGMGDSAVPVNLENIFMENVVKQQ